MKEVRVSFDIDKRFPEFTIEKVDPDHNIFSGYFTQDEIENILKARLEYDNIQELIAKRIGWK